MIKLTVSDFDGTLLPYGQTEISRALVGKIRLLTEKGIHFAVSSGRTYNELAEMLPMLTDKIYFICCDGAYCVFGGKVLYARKLENQDVRLFFQNTASDFSFVLHGATANYGYGNLPDEADVFRYTKVNGIDKIKEKIFKITSYGGEIKLPAYCGVRTHWDGGENQSAQFVNRYCDKGAALSDLQMRLMLTKYDTACIGDSGNDIVMMKGAKLSFCVGEKCPELSRVCTHKTETAESALDYIINNN